MNDRVLAPIRKRRVHSVEDLKESLTIVMAHLIAHPHESMADIGKALDAAARFARITKKGAAL